MTHNEPVTAKERPPLAPSSILSGHALTAYLRRVRATKPALDTTPCGCGHDALAHGADGCEGWLTTFDGAAVAGLCDCHAMPATVYEVARQSFKAGR